MAAERWLLALGLLVAADAAAKSAPAPTHYFTKQEILAMIRTRVGGLCDAPRLKGCILMKRADCTALFNDSIKRCEATYAPKLGAQYVNQAAATAAAEPINLCIIKDAFAGAARKKKLLNTPDCTTPPGKAPASR